MYDQRVEIRSLFGREYPGYGLIIGGVCPKAIYGFGWKRDKLALQQIFAGKIKVGRNGGHYFFIGWIFVIWGHCSMLLSCVQYSGCNILYAQSA